MDILLILIFSVLMFDIKDYDYNLPARLIAQEPAPRRDHSRLLVVQRLRQVLTEAYFYELPLYLQAGDLLVVNDSKVVPARLFGHKETGGRVEMLVLTGVDQEKEDHQTRWCLMKSSKRPKKGQSIFLDCGNQGEIQDIGRDGLVLMKFKGVPSVDSMMKRGGHIPLPPYIRRDQQDYDAPRDRERYQTVFSEHEGAVAAPTAGLHFTEELIGDLKRSGISIHPITLHVGPGTFRPVRVKDIRRHCLGEEYYRIYPETADAINKAREEGRRVIAVGTTVVRALESARKEDGTLKATKGKTGLFITPGFPFQVVDGLITNFHLPRSSLLFLVAAFAGLDLVKKAYSFAINKEYRFYSYGDAMLVF